MKYTSDKELMLRIYKKLKLNILIKSIISYSQKKNQNEQPIYEKTGALAVKEIKIKNIVKYLLT